jgi:hypothetical protein
MNPKGKRLPPAGRYYSKIKEATTEFVEFLDEIEGLCLVISYHLISVDCGKEYDFTETYYIAQSNLRIMALNDYLVSYGFDISMEEDLADIQELVEVTYEFLGCWAYPIICKREFLGKLPESSSR